MLRDILTEAVLVPILAALVAMYVGFKLSRKLDRLSEKVDENLGDARVDIARIATLVAQREAQVEAAQISAIRGQADLKRSVIHEQRIADARTTQDVVHTLGAVSDTVAEVKADTSLIIENVVNGGVANGHHPQ